MINDTKPEDMPSASPFPLVLSPQMRILIKARSERADISQSQWIRNAIEEKIVAENKRTSAMSN